MNKDYTNIDKICIPAELSKLAEIRGFIELKSSKFGFSEEQVYKISLAVDEACSNLIRHSYKFESNKNLCVIVSELNDQFKISIIDNGVAFNPTNHQTPNMIEYFKTFQKGGLGVHIIKSVMDEVEYNSDEKCNTLTLTKILKSA